MFSVVWLETAMIAFRTGAPFPWQLSDKESACNSGDVGLIPGSERSPGEGNGNLLHYSCLGNPMDYSPPGSSVRGIITRQEYWSRLPFPSPGDLPDPGIKPRSPALQADSLLTELRQKPIFPSTTYCCSILEHLIIYGRDHIPFNHL